MLHVDEGRLHAYLDGELEAIFPGAVAELEAHVAACALCAARLEEARRIREQSVDILRAAEVTGLRLPDFVGVEVEAPARRDPVPNHRLALQRRATALAWAASLVVALGIGWMARDLQLGRDTAVATREMEALAVAHTTGPVERQLGAEPVHFPAAAVHQEAAAGSQAAATAVPAVAVAEPRARVAAAPVPVVATDVADAGSRVAMPAPVRAAAQEEAKTAAPPAAAAPAAVPLVAQGRITTDAGIPLAGAHVSVPSLNVATISRADGSYRLPIPPQRLAGDSLGIRVQQVGYQPVTRQVTLDSAAGFTENFELHAQAVSLESVVVTGSAARQRSEAVPESGRLAARRAAAAPAQPQASEPRATSYVAGPAGRCSLAATPRHRDSSVAYFTLLARADTLLAGPGGTEYVQPATRPGQARSGGIFGQLAEVQRVGGAGSDEVERALRQRGSREVVVVPWAIDAACRPAPWTASARWLPLGQSQFVRGRLRPANLWVDGRPTFDLYAADSLPYPGKDLTVAPAGPATGARLLTAEQFFSLYAAMPTAEALRRDPGSAHEPLRRWRQQHPELADRFPASEIFLLLREEADR